MINKKRTIQNIDNLIAKFTDPAYPEDVDNLRGWRSQVERAIEKDSLKKKTSIKLITDKLKEDLVEMNLLLLNQKSEKLPDNQRDLLLDKKAYAIWFLGLFGNTDEEMKDIDKKVKEEEEHFEDNKENFTS